MIAAKPKLIVTEERRQPRTRHLEEEGLWK